MKRGFKIPYSEAAMRRILQDRNLGRVENAVFFCGAGGYDMIKSWRRCAAFWMPPDSDATQFDFSWLRGFEVMLQGHGEWSEGQEKAIALGLLAAGAPLIVSARYDARGKHASSNYYKAS